ncbi:PQQ-dependent sugar dehydrogenase [Pseudomonas promysalinigenes]|uniref:PQQ-dependent sugar dehydrogenase n=1 Tax=Pseudomonas promysalinigenes TaxID=485898 RepID=A0ABY6AFJ0_9PSED|nr:PQQ-dependent sugar dehydrogenase [Pseudomonas promysalinigenes]UXH38331.1 PQQ-dependent sugar dehydrogenase [Pseudomonas promysalinigenes]
MIRATWLTTLTVAALLPLIAHAAPEQQLPSEEGQLTVSTLADGLRYPWALAFLPGGKDMLVTERSGNLRVISAEGKVGPPINGVPKVWSEGQGGLLDVVLSPEFAKDRTVYLSYAEQGSDGKAGTAVGRGQLSEDRARLDNFNVIFRQQPKLSVGNHFGSRLVFDRDGFLFVALGENNQRPTAQDLDKLQGKVVRILPDGEIPKDNPFVGKQGVRPEIWSFGHRNQQGAALNPWTGKLWTHEHGPRGGDEINIPEPGKNYGWPIATHGINYSLLPIPEAKGKHVDGMVDPHHVWEKSPGISGMAFYDSPTFKAWDHNLFIGALASESLIRLQLDGDKVVHEERLLGELKARIRDVRVGPDGYLYVLTDAKDGALLKVGLSDGSEAL